MKDDAPKLAARQAIAANVRAELARKGRTGADAARHLGISKQALQPRLVGKRPFRDDELPRLAAWLEVPVDKLLDTRQEVAA